MLNFLNTANQGQENKMLSQCGLLTYAFAFYKILDSGMRRKGVDPEIQTAYWGLNFKEASRIFYNTALLHAKTVALRDDYAQMQIEETLKLDIYPKMKKAIEEMDSNNPDLNRLMMCHFLFLKWLDKIKSIGQAGFQKILSETNGEAILMSKRLLSEVSPPWDSVMARSDEHDYEKYSVFIERYFKLWISDGFMEEPTDSKVEEKSNQPLESILSQYLQKNASEIENLSDSNSDVEENFPGIL